MKCENQGFDRLVFDTVKWKNNGEEREEHLSVSASGGPSRKQLGEETGKQKWNRDSSK